MKNNFLYILGIILVTFGIYYVFIKKTSIVGRRGKFISKERFTSGFDAGRPLVVVEKNEIVEGTIEQIFVFNKNIVGIKVTKSLFNNVGLKQNYSVAVPIEQLTNLDGSSLV